MSEPLTPAEKQSLAQWEKAEDSLLETNSQERTKNAKAYIKQEGIAIAEELKNAIPGSDDARIAQEMNKFYKEISSKHKGIFSDPIAVADDLVGISSALEDGTAKAGQKWKNSDLDSESARIDKRNKLFTPEIQALFDKELKPILGDLKNVAKKLGHPVTLDDVHALLDDGVFKVENYLEIQQHKDGLKKALNKAFENKFEFQDHLDQTPDSGVAQKPMQKDTTGRNH